VDYPKREASTDERDRRESVKLVERKSASMRKTAENPSETKISSFSKLRRNSTSKDEISKKTPEGSTKPTAPT
jgi:hypothetical protein